MSITKFYNFSRSTIFILAIYPSEVIYEIWISLCCELDQGHMAKSGHLPCAMIWHTTKPFFFIFLVSFFFFCSSKLITMHFEYTLSNSLNYMYLIFYSYYSIILYSYRSNSIYMNFVIALNTLKLSNGYTKQFIFSVGYKKI